jgi:hypothetical protein
MVLLIQAFGGGPARLYREHVRLGRRIASIAFRTSSALTSSGSI